MPPKRPPVSLAAERAVRYLRNRKSGVASGDLAQAVLSTRIPSDEMATRVLEAAFGGDPRLERGTEGWRVREAAIGGTSPDPTAAPESDRVLLVLEGCRERRRAPFALRSLAAIRMSGSTVVAACGGIPRDDSGGADLREAVSSVLDGAVAIAHDPPGSMTALENWLGEPVPSFLSLRRLAQVRLGLPARHGLAELAARLSIPWRDTDDPVDRADVLESALASLRRSGENLRDLCETAAEGAPALDWSRFAFGRDFLRSVPSVPGTYRFLDARGELLYVGRSQDLNRRLASYFREGRPRPARVQRLLDALHRIEVEPVGSDLEAVLREAADILRRRPVSNVQRRTHASRRKSDRLRSILILEPAASPWVIRAYLVRDGRLIDRVGIGPRGGGLRRIARLLETRFFSDEPGPSSVPGPEMDVELVARWLATHRHRAVAFDPTHLRSTREVIARLHLFLSAGSLFEPDGTPIHPR